MTASTASIKAFWDSRAQNADLPEDVVTHPDRQQRLLEIEILLQYLPPSLRVLDVGCGNGFSTAIFAQTAAHVVGVDYLESNIRRARRNYGHVPNLEFAVQDVMALSLPDRSFDVVVSQRCLINLPSWEEQQQGLLQIARVVKPGGFFFMQEGTQQGRESLNQAREMLGVPRMPDVEYNLDFDERTLWPFLRRHYDVVEVRRLGLYDLISRIVHPMLVRPAEPRYDAAINEIARRVSARMRGADELAREFSAVLRRRAD
jgi:ubiquinone/menaquinone biosynthesis C-methylase UbiE